MPANLASALVYIIDALGGIVVGILLLRLLLPILGADFRNPIAQGILKVTSPIITPVRRIVPAIGRLDTATVLVAFIFQLIALWLIFSIYGQMISLGLLAFTAVIRMLALTIMLFIFAIVVSIIISWIAPGQYNPIAAIASTLSEPVLRPFRRVVPPIGGFDISPIFALIILGAIRIFILGIRPFW